MEVLIAVCSLMGIDTGVDVARSPTSPKTWSCRSWTSRSASTATR
jgi:hypothetical protein